MVHVHGIGQTIIIVGVMVIQLNLIEYFCAILSNKLVMQSRAAIAICDILRLV